MILGNKILHRPRDSRASAEKSEIRDKAAGGYLSIDQTMTQAFLSSFSFYR